MTRAINLNREVPPREKEITVMIIIELKSINIRSRRELKKIREDQYVELGHGPARINPVHIDP